MLLAVAVQKRSSQTYKLLTTKFICQKIKMLNVKNLILNPNRNSKKYYSTKNLTYTHNTHIQNVQIDEKIKIKFRNAR